MVGVCAYSAQWLPKFQFLSSPSCRAPPFGVSKTQKSAFRFSGKWTGAVRHFSSCRLDLPPPFFLPCVNSFGLVYVFVVYL